MADGPTSLERLTVLVVDDCEFIRELVCTVVTTLGVGQTIAAEDGADAVRKLTMTKHAPNKVGAARIDLVVSDIVMPQLNGIELLRWIRASQASPSRFMPVVMLSAASDPRHVEDARDAGANEFIVKPFTPQNVAQRLLNVINHPRDFYHCAKYFGPDRRRRESEPPLGERRKRASSDVRTTFPTHNQPKDLRSKDEVWRYQLINTLRGRVGGDGTREPTVDKERIAQAGEIIRESHADYDAWMAKALGQLKKLVDRAAQKPQAARPARGAITRIAVDLRGHGVMFSYPLISVVGKSLYDCMTRIEAMDEHAIALILAHIAVLDRIIDEDIKGKDRERGTALLNAITKARRTFQDRDEFALVAS